MFDGEVFFSHKKRYCFNVIAVCDHTLRFTYCLVGWPGSVHDSTAYDRTELVQHPDSFWSPGEDVIGDKAFSCTPTVIPPFKKPAANERQNKEFNRRSSTIRIDIEHSFGSLKSRWQSLKDLRVRIVDDKSCQFAVKWITACIVLHNFLLSLEDPEWEDELGQPEEDINIEGREGAEETQMGSGDA